jgi:hypothetical protein
MELNFAEIDNADNSYDNYDYNSHETENTESQKYWEQNLKSNQKTQPKKKKVTFTDILNNMNLVVNNQGVLQFMAPANSTNEEQYAQQQYGQQLTDRRNSINVEKKIEPLDPSVKHSYIYNKYFKDYKDVNVPKPVKVPKTKEEYIQMVVEERIRLIEERKRIAQIKSKKLMFTTNYQNPGNIQASKNNLRRMSFF